MTSRPANDDERAALKAALEELRQSKANRMSMLAGPSVTLLILLGLVWSLLYWIGRRFFGVDFGAHSAAAPWIVGVGALVYALILGPELFKIVGRTRSAISSLEADVASGTVEEMAIGIVQAIRLQEPEHGGFVYFLRTTDERVYVQFDYESQDLGANDQDPGESKYMPRETLDVVRTQRESRVLSSAFTGEPVPIVHDGKLAVKPEDWPEPDTFCSTPWSSLVSTYAG